MSPMKYEFDVEIIRRGTFSVWAESLEEAQEIVEAMSDERKADRVNRWWETEVFVS